MHPRPVEQKAQGLHLLQSSGQKRRVVAVGRGRDAAKRDATSVDGHRAFEASLSPVHWVLSRTFATTRSFRDAAIDGYLREVQTNDPVVGVPRNLFEGAHGPDFDPLTASTSQSGGRAGTVGYPPVGTSEHQHL